MYDELKTLIRSQTNVSMYNKNDQNQIILLLYFRVRLNFTRDPEIHHSAPDIIFNLF